MKRDFLSNVATAVLVLCAVVVTGLAVKRELAPAARAQPQLARRAVPGWERYATEGQVLGAANAPVRIVEFSDFQCPFCSRFSGTLRELRRRHSGRVAVLYRHFPLSSIHPHALDAAVAAECAGRQGRFEAFHDLLFAHQDSLGATPWARFAADAAVPDLPAFERCVAAPEVRRRVDRDVAAARQLSLEVTPTILVNGQLVPGAVSIDELERLIR